MVILTKVSSLSSLWPGNGETKTVADHGMTSGAEAGATVALETKTVDLVVAVEAAVTPTAVSEEDHPQIVLIEVLAVATVTTVAVMTFVAEDAIVRLADTEEPLLSDTVVTAVAVTVAMVVAVMEEATVVDLLLLPTVVAVAVMVVLEVDTPVATLQAAAATGVAADLDLDPLLGDTVPDLLLDDMMIDDTMICAVEVACPQGAVVAVDTRIAATTTASAVVVPTCTVDTDK